MDLKNYDFMKSYVRAPKFAASQQLGNDINFTLHSRGQFGPKGTIKITLMERLHRRISSRTRPSPLVTEMSYFELYSSVPCQSDLSFPHHIHQTLRYMQKLSPHLQLPSNNSEMLPDMEIHHTGVQDCDLQ